MRRLLLSGLAVVGFAILAVLVFLNLREAHKEAPPPQAPPPSAHGAPGASFSAEGPRAALGEAAKRAREERVSVLLEQLRKIRPSGDEVRPSGDEDGSARLPTSLEEALTPALADDLARRDPQAAYDMDYMLRLLGEVGRCVSGRTTSTGKLGFKLHFENDPDTRVATGLDLTPISSTLSPEDDKIVLACLRESHKGALLLTSEKFGQAMESHLAGTMNLPVEDSWVYMQVREGSYAAGTSVGYDVP